MSEKKSTGKNKKSTKSTKTIIIAILIIAAIIFIGYKKFGIGQTENIAASVNGETILKEDVLAEYLRVPVQYRDFITVDSILQRMIIDVILLQECSKLGITATDEEVDAHYEQLLKEAGKTEEEVLEDLKKNDFTLKELKASIKKDLQFKKLFDKAVLGDITVEEKEIKEYYDNNVEEFTTPEKIRAAHILVNTSKEAKSIRNKVLGGLKFEDMAEKYSTGPSGKNGGDLGWFGKGAMVKEFEDAAFDLELGEISQIVETQFGFHIIKLVDRSKESVTPYDDVKDDLEKSLLSEKQTSAVDIYIAQLEISADIEIFMTQPEEPKGKSISGLIEAQNEKAGAEAESDGKETTDAVIDDASEAEDELEDGAAADEPAVEEELSVAECLASKGAKMFGSHTSGISNEQKELFGDDFSEIDYTDCSSQKDICKENKVISYPTWIINGKKYPGKYSVERLAELSGCN